MRTQAEVLARGSPGQLAKKLLLAADCMCAVDEAGGVDG